MNSFALSIVDYKFKHRVSYSTTDQIIWCREVFSKNSFCQSANAIYFAREEDSMLFLLRWS